MTGAQSPSWLALASQSPRRLSLLRDAGFDPITLELDVDDSDLPVASAAPERTAMALAYFKAAAGARHPHGRDRVVLAADTFVVKDGEIIGKPRDAADADRIVRRLSGGAHVVLTGVAIIDARDASLQPPRWIFLDAARVRVGEVPDADRKAYIDSGHWRGKAGAYNLAERLSAGWPIDFVGDPGAVMGLPMRRLAPMLHLIHRSSQPSLTPP